MLNDDVEIDLNDIMNMMYTGPLYLGTPLQVPETSKFDYDTGSPDMLVSSTLCNVGCPNQYYNSTSSTSAQVSTDDPTTLVQYGDGSYLIGVEGTDIVCMTDSNKFCAPNFKFGVVTEGGNNIFDIGDGTSFDGMVGMSPAGSYWPDGVPLVQALYNA